MSLLSAPLARPLDEQASLLVAFLSSHQHSLTGEQALMACSDLPEDPKLAAKALKVRLAAEAIELKHTHALDAVATMRGVHGGARHLLSVRWDVAAWFADAPAVSANRKMHSRLSEAAEDVCARLLDQFEAGDKPLLRFSQHPTHVRLWTQGGVAPHWNILVVATGADGEPVEFPSTEMPRLAERVRRCLNGSIKGWLDLQVPGMGWESELLGEWLVHLPADSQIAERPAEWLSGKSGMPPHEWNCLQQRYLSFVDRLDEDFLDWSDSRLEGQGARFAGSPVDMAMVTEAGSKLGLSIEAIGRAAGIPSEAWERYVNEGEVPVHLFDSLTRTLHLSTPNDLCELVRTAPRIPLFRDEDLATWLSRIDGEVVRYPGDPVVEQGLEQELERFVALPRAIRLRWLKAVPHEIKRFARAAEAAGLVVCASMEKRFVQDLPLAHWRLGMCSVLSFESVEVVRNQPGLEAHDTEDDHVGGDITPEWLARFNGPIFTGEELMKLPLLKSEWVS